MTEKLLIEIAALVGSRREAGWIVEEALATPIASGTDRREALGATARALAWRRAAGEPLQHVLGHWSFRTLELRTDRRALVPRPETEQVVEVALAVLRTTHDLVEGAPLIAVDLGTGSGAIACSLVAEEPALSVKATDSSAEALALAEENRSMLPSEVGARLELLRGDWFDALPVGLRGAVDLVISNPPYLAEGELAGLDPVVRDFDPPAALVAGPTGLEAIEQIVSESLSWLGEGGVLVVEIAPHQEAAATLLATRAGLCGAHVVDDLAGRPRVLVASR